MYYPGYNQISAEQHEKAWADYMNSIQKPLNNDQNERNNV